MSAIFEEERKELDEITSEILENLDHWNCLLKKQRDVMKHKSKEIGATEEEASTHQEFIDALKESYEKIREQKNLWAIREWHDGDNLDICSNFEDVPESI